LPFFKKTIAGILLAVAVTLTLGSASLAQDVSPDMPPVAAQASTSDSGQGEASAPQGFFSILFSGGIVGFSIMLLLFGLSLTAAFLVFEHIMTIRRSELMPEGLGDHIRDLLQAGQAGQADQVCRDNPSFLSFVVLNGLAEIESGWPAVEKALEDATAEQAARLFRRIEYLSVIGNIAPMVGLLGTVTGMIFAFQQVAATQGSAGAGDLAEGIYQALVTTVGGLIVAIPSLGAFAVFRNRVDQLVAEAAYLAQHAMSPLKRRRVQKVASGKAAPPRTGGGR
jgi:biopolymer transport protein ExbB